jgi:hypothetical protein
MVGREVARLPDLVNHGRADQTVLTDDLSEIIVERTHGLQHDPGLWILSMGQPRKSKDYAARPLVFGYPHPVKSVPKSSKQVGQVGA